MKTAILSLLTFVLFSTAANAQANVDNHNVSMVLTNVITLSITTGDVSINLASVSDYTNGVASSSPTTLSVSSNKSYTITAYASSAATVSGDLTGTAGDIPLAKLTLKEGANAYVPISANSGSPTTVLATHAAGGSQSTNVTYFANPGFGYAAGTYTTNITYTATQL
jgi:hypothetical protein